MALLDEKEREIINIINRSARDSKNKTITLDINGMKINEITGANKYSGSLYGENEPYTDFIIRRRNTKGINIALKSVVFNESIQRLEIIVPGLKYKFIKAAYNKMIQINLETHQDVPNFFGRLNRNRIKQLIRGTYSVGGPIDYMYIDLPKTINMEFDVDTNLLLLPGILDNIDSYSSKINLYFNLRPLHLDQKFDSEIERGGMKLIYGRSPSRGESGNKIVVLQEQDLTKDAIVVDIEQ